MTNPPKTLLLHTQLRFLLFPPNSHPCQLSVPSRQGASSPAKTQLILAISTRPQPLDFIKHDSHCAWPELNCKPGTSVTGLTLYNINLTKPVPPFICDLNNLTHLDLGDNIPPGRFPIISLQLLQARVSRPLTELLCWQIPDDIDRLPRLQTPHPRRTISPGQYQQLSETLPTWNGHEFLFYNDISGEIPERIGSLPNLVIFKMFNMNLVRNNSSRTGEAFAARRFQVSVNRLTGKLPDDLCYHGKLVGLVAYQNSLTGELPSSIGKCDSLLIVTVYDNMLSGTFLVACGQH
ncbi:hypothetical protein M0R45_003447 [Rubus argutus]|uniref:Uncharacterized protein n=1 Tax=Rubus argutus TaxID=59490 RepID=A0AAW1YHT0_RUBAR